MLESVNTPIYTGSRAEGLQQGGSDLQDLYIDDVSVCRKEMYDSDAGSWLEVDFGKNKTFSQAFIKEGTASIDSYKIQYYNGWNWLDAYTGTTIGTTGATVSFTPVTAKKARIYIDAINEKYDICSFEIYN